LQHLSHHLSGSAASLQLMIENHQSLGAIHEKAGKPAGIGQTDDSAKR